MTTKSLPALKAEILDSFRLFWGIAPPDSLKGKKGAEIETFLDTALDRVAQGMWEAVRVEKEPRHERHLDDKTFCGYCGHNSAVSQQEAKYQQFTKKETP